MPVLLTGASVVMPDTILRDGYVLFDKEILSVGLSADAPSGHDAKDCSGLFLSPGFVDVHIHGCGGYDTMDGQDAVAGMSELLPRGGTTSFLATTVAASPDNLNRALKNVKAAQDAQQASPGSGAHILGAHVEGPFLCLEYKGAHEATVLTDPDFSMISAFSEVVRLVTLAPELSGAEGFIRSCSDAGIICSIGHTAASYAQCREALGWGARSFTHSYNAMSPLRHREPGTVGALLSESEAYAELICDNIHVHPAAQAVVYRSKGYERTILITDALRPCMKGDGPFMLGNLAGETINGQARLLDGTLAGSVLTMNLAVRHFRENTGCPLHEAVHCATATPSKLLGLTQKGRIAAGCDADLVLLTPDLDVTSTYVGGLEAYKRGD